MPGLSKVFETARRSLFAQRDAMDVTSHNIANAGTTGYTRQRAELTTTTPLPDRVGLLGTGVEMSSVSRLREKFIDTQYRNTNQSLSNASMQSRIFSQIEAIINEPSSNGLQSMMQGFSKAWQALAATPEDMGARQSVLQSASTLANGIQQIYSGLNQLRSDMKDEISSDIDKINELAKGIADFNEKIITAQNSGMTANDLMDSRDLKIDELSKIANIRTSFDAKGAINVSVGGISIVNQTDTVALRVRETGTKLSVTTTDFSSTATLTAGELGGLMTQYNTTIPGYLSSIDEFGQSIMDSVNQAHASGYGLKASSSDPSAPTGTLFFSSYGNGVLSVNSSLATNPRLIAASSTGAAGDNIQANKIANIFDQPTMNGGTVSHNQFYTALVGKIGTDSSDASREEASQNLILSQIEAQRNSFSGVSLDEEMTNMIRYQRAYDASAKLVKVVDEMMTTIIQTI
ncbi:MAG: flagellar hook-associated protein FlgK [Acidobacteriota bacterium]